MIEMFFNILLLPVLVNTKSFINDDSCGIVLPGVTRALISGDYEDRAAPWTVSLGYNDEDGLHRHFCTGVIIKGNKIQDNISIFLLGIIDNFCRGCNPNWCSLY